MKNKLLFLLFFINHFVTISQCEDISVELTTNFSPFQISSIIESDGLRNGDDYKDATLYFPINNTENLKSIILVPGYQATQSSVALWAEYLAKRGIVSMTIGTNSLNDLPAIRADALIDAMETIREENERVSSPLYHKIDINNIAVGGWSMGGGGAQLAAKIDSSIKAVLSITPWLWPNTLSELDLNHNTPVLIISGEVDPIAPNNQHSNVHYNYTPNSTPKLLFEVSEADHNIPLDPSIGNGDLGNVAYAWLQLFLYGDMCYCEFLETDLLDQNLTASNYLTNLNCATLDRTTIKISDLNFKLNPNPFSNTITINLKADEVGKIEIFSTNGVLVNTIVANKDITILDTSNLTKGMYLLRLSSNDGKYVVKKMIKI
ncbi:MAG: dienelactone hydrolase [Polaribacter sp.]|jgi:dienelactone hydrolase|uniref:T9SS type A sorting domain-containing protein n=1 Tax=Polaribacter sp. TaxID=1920175 RepID=UPI003AD96003|tara:strand:+ start:188 stop:1315 length:1128 start_codon:yes stop_codon:yes gene_type:complete